MNLLSRFDPGAGTDPSEQGTDGSARAGPVPRIALLHMPVVREEAPVTKSHALAPRGDSLRAHPVSGDVSPDLGPLGIGYGILPNGVGIEGSSSMPINMPSDVAGMVVDNDEDPHTPVGS